MKTGTLRFLWSKNPRVFKTPLRISFLNTPRLNESFVFWYHPFNICNLSATKRLIRIGTDHKYLLIETRNSLYALTNIREGK